MAPPLSGGHGMSENVVAMFGGPSGVPEVHEGAVSVLEEMLEMARAGQIVGVVGAFLYYDRCAGYQMGGKIGGYALVGALDAAMMDVRTIIRDAQS